MAQAQAELQTKIYQDDIEPFWKKLPGFFAYPLRFTPMVVIGSLALVSILTAVTGGLLIHADIWGLDWRPIFLINVPIGIACVVAGRALIPDVKGNPGLRNDWVGIALAAVATFALIFPLIEGRGFGWPAWTFVMMAAFVPVAALFVWWERRQNARGAAELVPLSLMHNRNFVVGALGLMVFFSAMPGFFLILALFLQSGYQLDALHSGLTTIPFPIGVLIASVITGRLGGKAPKLRIIFGSAALIVSALLLRHAVAGVGDRLVSTDFILPLVIGGLGTGITISPLSTQASSLITTPPWKRPLRMRTSLPHMRWVFAPSSTNTRNGRKRAKHHTAQVR